MRRGAAVLAVAIVLLTWGAGAARADHGAVLERDDFDDPAAGRFPAAATDPRLRTGYLAGEYQIAIIDPSYQQLATARVTSVHADVALAVSVRFEGQARDRYAVVACRAGAAGHYRLSVDPSDGSFRLARWRSGVESRLAGGASPLIRRGLESNRLEIACTGSTIAAIINGQPAASVTDTALTEGELFFGAGAYAGESLTLDARFDRYVLTRPGGEPAPSPAPTPAPPAPGSLRVAGALTIEGTPAPPGTAVRALVGERECGSVRVTQPGRYSLLVLPESAAAGCGRDGAEVRLSVVPTFGSGWRQPAGFPFQTGGVLARDLIVDLRRLTGDANNVPWTAAWWDNPRGMSIGICDGISDSSARAVLAGYQQWVDAYYDLGFVLELVHDDEAACVSDLPGIMFMELDLGDDDTIAGSINLIAPNDACERNVPCWSAKAAIVINPGPFAQVDAQEQANIIAHEIGHALGLGHSRACNGGTIMWATTACRFPMTHIGVDDVASLNAKFAVVGFTGASAGDDGWLAKNRRAPRPWLAAGRLPALLQEQGEPRRR